MSLIQIADLHSTNLELTTLTESDLAMIIGGSMARLSLSSNNKQIAAIEPYNATYSISLANINKIKYFGASSGASFDASFTIDGYNSKQIVNSAIGYIAQSSSPYIQPSH